jgi:hypothetical protein
MDTLPSDLRQDPGPDAGQFRYHEIVAEIGAKPWEDMSPRDMTQAAWAYYFFSVQFRENLLIARQLRPDDAKLAELEEGECDTDNLSPWPGVARSGERMNHDEFMRRTLELGPIDPDEAARLRAIGEGYLAECRAMDPATRAISIASYEDGGLETVFGSMLRFRDWNDELLRAFKHFLEAHIEFDSDPEGGHGTLSRHLAPDDRVLPLWEGFRDLFAASVPALSR